MSEPLRSNATPVTFGAPGPPWFVTVMVLLPKVVAPIAPPGVTCTRISAGGAARSQPAARSAARSVDGEGAVVDGDVTEGAEPGAGAVGGVGEGEGERPVPVVGRARAGRGGLGHTVRRRASGCPAVSRVSATWVSVGPGGAGRAEHRAGRRRAGGIESGGEDVVGEGAPGALAQHEVAVDQRRARAGDDPGGAVLLADVGSDPGDQRHLVGRLHGVGDLGCCTCGGDDGIGVDGESATGDPGHVAGVVDGQVERCAGAAVGDGGAGAFAEVVVDDRGWSGGGGGDGPGDGGGVGAAVLVVGGEFDAVGGAGSGGRVDGAGDLAGGGVDAEAGWKAGGGVDEGVVVVVGGVDAEIDRVALGVGLVGDRVEDGGDVDRVDGPVDGGGVGAALLVVDGEVDGVDRVGGGGLGDGAGDLPVAVSMARPSGRPVAEKTSTSPVSVSVASTSTRTVSPSSLVWSATGSRTGAVLPTMSQVKVSSSVAPFWSSTVTVTVLEPVVSASPMISPVVGSMVQPVGSPIAV